MKLRQRTEVRIVTHEVTRVRMRLDQTRKTDDLVSSDLPREPGTGDREGLAENVQEAEGDTQFIAEGC